MASLTPPPQSAPGSSQPESLPGAAGEAGTQTEPSPRLAPLSWGKAAHVAPQSFLSDLSTRFGHSFALQHRRKPSKAWWAEASHSAEKVCIFVLPEMIYSTLPAAQLYVKALRD